MPRVSYLRYTPDVCPPPVELHVRPRGRALRWILGTLVYLALVAGWTWWMTIPPKLKPPLAIIPLPDGTELRLIHVARGPQLNVDSRETFGGRTRRSNERYPQFNSLDAPPNSIWLIFTQYNPRTDRVFNPNLPGFWVVEEQPHFNHRIVSHPNVGSERSFQPFVVETAPIRAATWKVQINFRGNMIQASMPNPFPSTPAVEFSPKPLPQTVAVGDATIELSGLNPGKRSAWNLSELPSVRPQIKITAGELRESSFDLSYEFFDATGNATSDGVLPFSEPAWGLRVRAVQSRVPKGGARDVVVLTEIAVPGPGEMLSLSIPPFLKENGVTDLLFVGGGSYSFYGKLMRSTDPAGKTRDLPIVTPIGGSLFTFNDPCVLLLCAGRPQMAPAPLPSENLKMKHLAESIFQVRDGEKVVATNSRGSSSSSGSGSNYTIFNRQFPLKAGTVPGAKIRLEYVVPRVLEATFYFPPPDALQFR